MPTITSKRETDTKFRSDIYTQCIVIGERMAFLPLTINQCNINCAEGRITEPPIWAYLLRKWNNLTAPLHYGAAARQTRNQDDSSAGRAMPEKDFLYLVENYKLNCHGLKQLPLPPMMISEMKRIFSAAESLVYAPNRTHKYGLRIHLQMTGKHALGDCKLK